MASTRPAPEYVPRRAGEDLLYEVLEAELSRFLNRTESMGRPLPRHVERELRAYLCCGIARFGFTWLRCDDCKLNRLVAFSCKGRGFCPSCGGRRMAQTAANLVDTVLPKVPVRQWVMSLPFPLRIWVARRPKLRAAVLRVLLRVVRAILRKATGERDGSIGAICFHQYFGSSLNLNVHLHVLVLDGVYVHSDEGPPAFVPAPRLTPQLVERAVQTVHRRVERMLRRRGLLDEAPEADPDDGQVAIQEAVSAGRAAMGKRAGRRTRRLRLADPSQASPSRLCAESGWFSLHAGVRIGAQDRAGLERLCRYVTRPPLSHSRLTSKPDGTLVLALKTPWRDGTSHLLLSPTELLTRLAAIIPPPKSHLVTYHGVLAPASKLRGAIVPGKATNGTPCCHRGARPGERWIPWAPLLARSFNVDALKCPGCAGRLKVKQIVRGVWVANRLLRVLLPEPELPIRLIAEHRFRPGA